MYICSPFIFSRADLVINDKPVQLERQDVPRVGEVHFTLPQLFVRGVVDPPSSDPLNYPGTALRKAVEEKLAGSNITCASVNVPAVAGTMREIHFVLLSSSILYVCMLCYFMK